MTRTENAFISPPSEGGKLGSLPVVTVDHINFKTTDPDHFPAAYNYNMIRFREGIDIYLNDAYFTAADTQYEFEIQRSEMVSSSDLDNESTMQDNSGDYYDFFDATQSDDVWKSFADAQDLADIVNLDRVSSVFLEKPIPDTAPISTIQVRVKNQDFSRLTVVASGLVQDLTGSPASGRGRWLPVIPRHTTEMFSSGI